MVIKSSVTVLGAHKAVCPLAGDAVNWAVSLPSVALLDFCCVLLTALAESQQKCIKSYFLLLFSQSADRCSGLRVSKT